MLDLASQTNKENNVQRLQGRGGGEKKPRGRWIVPLEKTTTIMEKYNIQEAITGNFLPLSLSLARGEESFPNKRVDSFPLPSALSTPEREQHRGCSEAYDKYSTSSENILFFQRALFRPRTDSFCEKSSKYLNGELSSTRDKLTNW